MLVHLIGEEYILLYSFSEHVLTWSSRTCSVKRQTNSLKGPWDHEGRCLAHTGVGVGQEENGTNIFAKQTELQDVLRLVQKRER